MVVWQIIGDRIGHDDCGAAYYPTEAEAMQAIRDHHEWRANKSAPISIHKIVVENSTDLCRQLNDAMGFGGS